MLSRDSELPHHERNSMGTSRKVVEYSFVQEKYFRLYLECNETWRRVETGTAKFNNTDIKIYHES